MSEIKGQILGVLLVLLIFAAVSGILITAFSNASNKISERITNEIDENKHENFTITEKN